MRMFFAYRNLKPDNLVFDPLCFENSKNKNDTGIIVIVEISKKISKKLYISLF